MSTGYDQRDETASETEQGSSALITSDKVNGTDVYNDAGDRLGEIDSIVIDKYTGEVAYVVMSFGGFLGIGEKFHPLPWDVLEYDTRLGGYRVDLDRDDLIDAPSYDRESVDTYDYDTDAGGINGFYVGKSRLPRDYQAGQTDIDTGSNRPSGDYSGQSRATRQQTSGSAASGSSLGSSGAVDPIVTDRTTMPGEGTNELNATSEAGGAFDGTVQRDR